MRTLSYNELLVPKDQKLVDLLNLDGHASSDQNLGRTYIVILHSAHHSLPRKPN